MSGQSVVIGEIENERYQARIVEWHGSGEARLIAKLRHDYFVRQREWVVRHENDGLEVDCYDDHALHLAVFKSEEIAAYLRFLPDHPDSHFMLDREFRCLLPDGLKLHRDQAAELSRLVVCDALCEAEKTHALELLFKLFYQTALGIECQHFYIVVEPCWLRLCRQRFGFAFSPIGPVHTFPNGTRTVAAYASLHDLECSMQSYSMEKFHWYATHDAAPIALCSNSLRAGVENGVA